MWQGSWELPYDIVSFIYFAIGWNLNEFQELFF